MVCGVVAALADRRHMFSAYVLGRRAAPLGRRWRSELGWRWEA